MEMYTLSQWVMFFYIYCFVGWVWESVYVSVCTRKLVNRGFLKGPFLPIYGSGAICILIVTIPFRDSLPLMCLIGMVSATVLEYVTGAVMERLFRVRYWDYTGKLLNVNGYICLASVLCWGVMTGLLVEVVHPYVARAVLFVEDKYITGIVLLITPCISADFATSFHAAIRLRDILVQSEKIKEELGRLTAKKDELEQALLNAGGKAREQVAAELKELLVRTGEQKERLRIAYARSIKGLIERNPHAVSRNYREAFAELKLTVLEKKQDVMDRIDEIRR